MKRKMEKKQNAIFWDYILWGLKKAREKFGIEGIEYVIQRKFTNLSEKIEDEP